MESKGGGRACASVPAAASTVMHRGGSGAHAGKDGEPVAGAGRFGFGKSGEVMWTGCCRKADGNGEAVRRHGDTTGEIA